MSRFSNKVVLVTGALGGIGSAVVRRLASEGARLAITDRDKTTADVPPDLAAGADDSIFFAADLTRESEVAALFRAVIDRYGRIDALINVAGFDNDAGVPLEKLTLDRLHANLDTNLATCLLCCQAAAAGMKKQKSGAIVNMTSLTWRGSQQQFTYSAAKGGVYALTRSLALALGHGPESLLSLGGYRPLVDAHDVLVLGHRDLDRWYEPDVLREQREAMQSVDVAGLRREGIEHAVVARMGRLRASGIDGLWIHLDVDVLDPGLMPAVDCPEPGGLLADELVQVLDLACATGQVAGMHVTIYDPERDPDQRCGRLLVDILARGLARLRS